MSVNHFAMTVFNRIDVIKRVSRATYNKSVEGSYKINCYMKLDQ